MDNNLTKEQRIELVIEILNAINGLHTIGAVCKTAVQSMEIILGNNPIKMSDYTLTGCTHTRFSSAINKHNKNMLKVIKLLCVESQEAK